MTAAWITFLGLTPASPVILQDALATMRVTAQTCVSTTVAAGARDQVLVEVTCNGETALHSIFPKRMNLIAATSLVVERFAELGYASSCQTTFHRVPLRLSPQALSVICIHPRR